MRATEVVRRSERAELSGGRRAHRRRRRGERQRSGRAPGVGPGGSRRGRMHVRHRREPTGNGQRAENHQHARRDNRQAAAERPEQALCSQPHGGHHRHGAGPERRHRGGAAEGTARGGRGRHEGVEPAAGQRGTERTQRESARSGRTLLHGAHRARDARGQCRRDIEHRDTHAERGEQRRESPNDEQDPRSDRRRTRQPGNRARAIQPRPGGAGKRTERGVREQTTAVVGGGRLQALTAARGITTRREAGKAPAHPRAVGAAEQSGDEDRAGQRNHGASTCVV